MNAKQHQVAYQNYTLLTAVAAGNEWTIAEINKLKDMKVSGASIKEIAIALGRTFYSVQTQVSNSNITKPRKTTKPAATITACPKCFLVHTYQCEE